MPVQSPVQSFLQTDAVLPDMSLSQGAKATSFIDSIPLKVVLALAAPYLAGETEEQAIELAHKEFQQNKFTSTLDILGEGSQTVEQCELSVESYFKLIDAIRSLPLPVSDRRRQMTVSFKPSMFNVGAPCPGRESERALEAAFDRISRVVDYAFKNQVNMTLEAEDHPWTNFHVEAYLALINAGYTNLGTVLQSRLFRTEKDLKRFDERMRVRLVIGIYNEPAQIAHVQKPMMKQLLIKYAGELLAKGTYVELATHDVRCIEQFFTEVAIPQRISQFKFETQFLHGVPRKKLQKGLISGSYFSELSKISAPAHAQYLEELERTGIVVRLYLPYGRDNVAGPYCRRRLKENPNMIGYGIKNFFGLQ